MGTKTIIDEMLALWRRWPVVLRLVAVNAAVFVALRLVAIALVFSGHEDSIDAMLRLVEVPSRLSELAARPWTPVTYMFAQYDVLHVLFNMLWLYWFGTVLLHRCTPRQVLRLYLVGGLAGAALFLVACNTMPVFAGHQGWLIGSSAGVIAIVAASALVMPDYRFNLMFIGSVSLKWLAVITIGLDLIGVTGANAGGHIAHIGGALAGAWCGWRMRRGHATLNFRVALPRVRRSQRPRRAPKASVTDQEVLDRILDKIKRSGYTSLTADERRRLFDVSRRIK